MRNYHVYPPIPTMCDIKLAMLLGVEILTIQPTIWSTRRSFDEHVFGLLKWAVLLSGNSFQEKLAPLSKISHLPIRKMRIVREGVAVCCSLLQCDAVCCCVLFKVRIVRFDRSKSHRRESHAQ